MTFLEKTRRQEAVAKVIVFKGWWTVDDVINNPMWLFVFGDNNAGYGKGGQAIIRDYINTIGIPTKKSPSNKKESFYTDSEFESNKKRIDNAIKNIISLAQHYVLVVLPEDGFGTGLADLPNRAPKTFNYLQTAVSQMVEKLNA
jgi:hypothetical protein